jgi:ArsR family transcriptional regulator
MNTFCPKKWNIFFKAVHNTQRQLILDIIKNNNEINANGIVKKIHLSQPTVSHHLNILCDASIIKAKKIGKDMIYSINCDCITECCGGFMNKFNSKSS